MRRAAWLLAAFAVIAVSACTAELAQDRSRATFAESLKKAERGDRVAAFRVGESYQRGIGTARDSEKALRWFETAGPHGWYAIGAMYDEGNGVPRDADQAASYYRRAAQSGAPVSMYSLGCLYADRRVAVPDDIEGYMWLLIAKKIGESTPTCARHYECDQWARNDRPGCRSHLERALTAEERAEAERRAADWLAAWSRSKK